MSNFRSERSLGLIDGIYAIALTLLALEFPGKALPMLKSGDIFSVALAFYITIYISIFILIYDVWLIHKTLFMSLKNSLSKRMEAASLILMALIALAPGIGQDVFEILIDNQGEFQSDEVNKIKILLLLYFSIVYGLCSYFERLSGFNCELKNIGNYALGRCLFFTIITCLSIITYEFGYVAPLPLVVILMFFSKFLLGHVSDATTSDRRKI